MSQKDLFERDEYSALADDVDAIGRKEVAAMFKGEEPDFDPEDGAKWVSNCLDRDRKHKFDLKQITAIVNEARKKGSYAYMTYLNAQAWFEPPVPKTYDGELQKVSDQLTSIFEKADSLVQHLGKLKEQVKK